MMSSAAGLWRSLGTEGAKGELPLCPYGPQRETNAAGTAQGNVLISSRRRDSSLASPGPGLVKCASGPLGPLHAALLCSLRCAASFRYVPLHSAAVLLSGCCGALGLKGLRGLCCG